MHIYCHQPLDHVDETASGTASYTGDIEDQVAGNYEYDEIGNLAIDDQEEIGDIATHTRGIEWTVYGKIRRITRKSGSDKPDLEFRYDAMGNRICKIVKPKNTSTHLIKDQRDWVYTYYMRDASGNLMAVYNRTLDDNTSNIDDKMTVVEQDIYAASRVGLKRPLQENGDPVIVGGYTFTPGTVKSDGTFPVSAVVDDISASRLFGGQRQMLRKSYELSNHLGNVYAVVTDKKMGVATTQYPTSVSYYTADVISATDYFAFGAPENGRIFNSTDYRYGFNGKENDPEVVETGEGTQDYGMRIYNPGLGRFLSVDPLTMFYPMLTPYQFAENSPIRYIDLDGMEAYDPNTKQYGPWSEEYLNSSSQDFVSTNDPYAGYSNAQIIAANNIATSLFDPSRNQFVPYAQIDAAVNSLAQMSPELIYGPGQTKMTDWEVTPLADGSYLFTDIKLEEFRALVYQIYSECQISDMVGDYFKYQNEIMGPLTTDGQVDIIRERSIEGRRKLDAFNFILQETFDMFTMTAGGTYMFEPEVPIVAPRLTLPKAPTLDEYMATPNLIEGKSLQQVQAELGEIPPNWKVGTLKGQEHAGQGWALREVGANGEYTGRTIRWHPGSSRPGHFGNGKPYWTITSGEGGKTQWISK